VNVADATGVPKRPVDDGELVPDHGIAGDAHAGPGARQVSLLSLDAVERMRAAGADVGPGSFAENLTIADLDPIALPLGTRVALGESAVLVVTQHGKECHDRCAVFEQAGDCVMPREGVFARVEIGGTIAAGDGVRVLPGAEEAS
jgi:cyclic pyranopterin phosphate synthase